MAVQAWQQVTCSTCGRTYQCTPWDDFYESDGHEGGRCESCLLGYLPLAGHVFIQEDSTLAGPFDTVPSPGGES